MAANQKYGFTITPTADAGFNPVVNMIAGPAANCEATPRTCRSGVDSALSGQPESGGFSNSTGAALELFVVVADNGQTATNRDYSLVSTLGAIPAGETCGVPLVATAGPVAAQSTAGATFDVVYAAGATGCSGIFSPKVDRVYSVAVPANQTLTVVATPAAMEDLVVNIVDGPAANCANVMACLVGADVGNNGDPETVMLAPTNAARTVFVVITAFGGSAANFSLNLTIQ